MSRLSPGLLYLTIYNPTLKPIGEVIGDREDAEEQAHILFYTARERAVSRDKMLRQVGLAKALINFAGLFDSASSCENVHSQSRRMIMLSPESNFWIHACVELAKTPRPAVTKGKSKGKGKEPEQKVEVIYDCHDGSVRDVALRAHIRRGYEQFKLTHGSFTSILANLGQEALELQVERFFTVWAWKWDTDEENEFASHLGPPLHPLTRSLTPILDDFTSQLTFDTTLFALIPPHTVPSTKLMNSNYSNNLPRHIMTRLPPPPPPTTKPEIMQPSISDDPTIHASTPRQELPANHGKGGEQSADEIKPGTAFMNIPPMNLNLDVRNIKWNWPGYLTFGKANSARPSVPTTPLEPSRSHSSAPSVNEQEEKPTATPPAAAMEDNKSDPRKDQPVIDTESLQEAMESDGIHAHPSAESSPLPSPPVVTPLPEGVASPITEESSPDSHLTAEETPLPDSSDDEKSDNSEDHDDTRLESSTDGLTVGQPDTPPVVSPPPTPPPPEPLPSFLQTTVFLPEGDDPSNTARRKVLHLTRNAVTLAFVVPYDLDLDLPALAEDSVRHLKNVDEVIESDARKSLEMSLPNVTKILEPQDKYVISTARGYTSMSQQGMTSKSEHLFNGQHTLHSDFDVVEVFSRGQNPQHWHLSRRGLGIDHEGNPVDGEVYMEIAKKESTLTDVENQLAGVVKRFSE